MLCIYVLERFYNCVRYSFVSIFVKPQIHCPKHMIHICIGHCASIFIKPPIDAEFCNDTEILTSSALRVSGNIIILWATNRSSLWYPHNMIPHKHVCYLLRQIPCCDMKQKHPLCMWYSIQLFFRTGQSQDSHKILGFRTRTQNI